YAELLEVILAKEYGHTKVFRKINFPFSEKQQAEKILFEALNIIVTEGGEQASKVLYILDKFDAHINSNDVKSFWEDVRLQNVQVKTRSNQLILTGKKRGVHCTIHFKMMIFSFTFFFMEKPETTFHTSRI
ncbi:3069_t:CDS:1, partial [Funneliformis mosseae]